MRVCTAASAAAAVLVLLLLPLLLPLLSCGRCASLRRAVPCRDPRRRCAASGLWEPQPLERQTISTSWEAAAPETQVISRIIESWRGLPALPGTAGAQPFGGPRGLI